MTDPRSQLGRSRRGPGALDLLALLLLGVLPAVAPARLASRSLPGEETAAPSEAGTWIGRARELAQEAGPHAAAERLLDLGRSWLTSGRTEEAIALLEEAVRLVPDSSPGWSLLGRAHTRNRDFDAAEEALTRAVELGDAAAPTLVFLGAVQWENGDLAAAERTYVRAVESGGAGGLALSQLGRLRLWQGRYAEAADTLGEAARAGQSGPDVLFDLAEALRGADRVEEAVEVYRRVTRAAPTMIKARYGLAVSLGSVGLAAESAAEFARYERLYREDQERTRVEEREKGEMERVRSLLEAGEVDAALARLEGMAQSADVLVLAARAHTLAGRDEEALAALERAVSLDPARPDLRRLLSEMRMTSRGEGE